jgi:uncharacterized protein YacL
MNIEIVFRLVGMAAFGFVGWMLGYFTFGQAQLIPITVGGAIFGGLATPYFTTRPARWIGREIRRASPHTLLSAAIGLAISLIFSALLALPLSQLPGLYGGILPAALTVLLACFGIWLMVMRGEEVLELFGFHGLRGKGSPARNGKVIVDTSAIIDGRITDITRAGFISSQLLIPEFILAELQHIADSSDALKRNRGRRGLETLNRLQKEAHVPMQILDIDVEGVEEVDAKLVKLATRLSCPIITNDFNLNRVAQLQGVQVLNINELANAVKPAVLPGEEMEIRIVQEGKEHDQGVGFLDDGTMVVVENGRRHLESNIEVVIARVLQTAAGRMIFAHVKNGEFYEKGNG